MEAVVDPLTGAAFSLVRCGSCGMGRTEPQPADLAPFYPAAYYGGRHGATAGFCVRRRLRFLNTSSHYLISLLNLLPQRLERDEVKRLRKETKIWRSGHRADGGKLLDIGCGDGSFLLAAQAQGWVVTGVERFPEDAREKGLEVFSDVGELMSGRDGGSPSGGRSDRPPFDCITLWHSLEHMADPFALLGEVSALLKPGGRVIVAVPDNGGWQARLFGRFWLHLDVPRHLWHFTGPALGEAFQKAGLEVVQTVHQEFEYDLLGWSQSALNALFKTPNVFFNWLTKKPTGVGAPMLVVQVALGLGLTGLSVPLVWLGSLFKRGGTLVVVGGRSVLGTGGTVGTVGH
jgi:SAM-dependent methyltransferase